jgi:hypothetical protein
MLDAFGLAAVTATLIFYALEDRSPWYILAFAGGCIASAVYAFLQGAWPFGVIEIGGRSSRSVDGFACEVMSRREDPATRAFSKTV